jgi:copper chaperone NosL
VAGWIVAGAGALAFMVWLVEWYRHHKSEKGMGKRNPMPAVAVAASFLLFLTSCASKPEPIAYGKDICYNCKMGMSDTKFGAEVITKKGKIYKFDDLHCMIGFLKSGIVIEKDLREKVVINYEKQNDFLDIKTAWFVINPALKSPMGSNAAGFATKQTAQEHGQAISWDELYNQIN